MKILSLLIGITLSFSVFSEVIETLNTNNSTITTNGSQTTTIKQPPPSAVSPQISSGSGDLCTISYSGAVQTQILGISAGTTMTEENCIRLKNAKFLFDSGMKVASVSLMCQDKRVFDAMMMAGTPCPYNGMIGDEAKIGWSNHEEKPYETANEDELTTEEVAGFGGLGMLGWLLFL